MSIELMTVDKIDGNRLERKVLEVLPAPVSALCCSPVLVGELPPSESQDLAAALRVLADPARLRLVSLIRTSPGARALTRDLVTALGLSQPTVSHHLGVLFDAGFVRREREGRETWYSIEPDAFRAVVQLLDPGPAEA